MALRCDPFDDGAMIESSSRTQWLVRPRADRLIGGVAAGMATNGGINPWWIRAGFLVLVPFGGLGLVLYLVCWLVIPGEGQRSVAAQMAARVGRHGMATTIGVVLIGVAGLVLLSSLSLISTRVLLAGSLFVVGIVLHQNGRLR